VKLFQKSRRRLVLRWSIIVCLMIHSASLIARGGGPLHRQIEVSAAGIRIEAIIIRKKIAMSDLQISNARIVDIDQEPSLRPWIKLYGVGLPTNRQGWFVLKNRRKALLMLKRFHRVVYIPTDRGYALLLSPAQPEEFLNALQNPPVNGRIFSIESTP
jgi:hypothetical protein